MFVIQHLFPVSHQIIAFPEPYHTRIQYGRSYRYGRVHWLYVCMWGRRLRSRESVSDHLLLVLLRTNAYNQMPPWPDAPLRYSRELVVVGRRHASQHQRRGRHYLGGALAPGG